MSETRDTILVVDDEPGILKVYQDLLAPAPPRDMPRSSRGEAPSLEEFSIGCDLLAAGSGEEAVRLAGTLYERGGRLTACFVDMRMPGGIDGLETAIRLRALDPRLIVTFVTAYQDRSLIDIGAALGPEARDQWDYLNKPFTRVEILQKARNMIAGWNRRSESEALMRELREANEALRRKTEELEAARGHLLHSEKIALVGTMAAGVAHELNNPLTSIIGYTQLALRAGDLNKERARLERVAEQATRAAGIVKNLLSFARKGSAEKSHLGLNGIIRKCIELQEYQLRTSSITVETDLDPDLPFTMLDFNEMQQVFINLMTNAEQAMVDADLRGAIRISTRVSGGRIEATVTDSGRGIPDDVRPRLFDPFFTTKEVGRGTGLGLSICYGIVQDHGGEIVADNASSGGASFTIRLPITPGAQAVAQAAESASSAGGGEERRSEASDPQRQGTGPRVLLVDDEPTILDFGYIALSAAGYRVATASNGEGALSEALKRDYDVLVTDIRMPRMGGFELGRKLVERNPRMAGRILFITGDIAAISNAGDGLPSGSRWLAKPFSHEQLLEAVAALAPAEQIRDAASGAGQAS